MDLVGSHPSRVLFDSANCSRFLPVVFLKHVFFKFYFIVAIDGRSASERAIDAVHVLNNCTFYLFKLFFRLLASRLRSMMDTKRSHLLCVQCEWESIGIRFGNLPNLWLSFSDNLYLCSRLFKPTKTIIIWGCFWARPMPKWTSRRFQKQSLLDHFNGAIQQFDGEIKKNGLSAWNGKFFVVTRPGSGSKRCRLWQVGKSSAGSKRNSIALDVWSLLASWILVKLFVWVLFFFLMLCKAVLTSCSNGTLVMMNMWGFSWFSWNSCLRRCLAWTDHHKLQCAWCHSWHGTWKGWGPF